MASPASSGFRQTPGRCGDEPTADTARESQGPRRVSAFVPGFPANRGVPGPERPPLPGSRPQPRPVGRLGPRRRKTPPFPVAYSIPPRPTTRGGRDQGGLRKLINQVPAQPPGGGEGRGGAAAAVAGVTGGRRCRGGRDFTLPAGSCATRARSCVASNRHPLAPAGGQVSEDPREEKKTPPCGLEKPAVLAARVPASSACSFGVSSVRNPLSGFWRQLQGERAGN